LQLANDHESYPLRLSGRSCAHKPAIVRQ
jgi:hypothetical protein